VFLSRILMNWDQARNPYNWHRALWRLFPGQPGEARGGYDENRSGFLFRIEDYQTGRPAVMMTQSPIAPKAEIEGMRVLRCSKPFEPVLRQGERLQFLLTANPTRKITDEASRGKPRVEREKCRVPLIREEDQRDWLVRKLNGAARLNALEVRTERLLYFRKKEAGKIVPVTFEGVLRVEDGEAFLHLMRNGIGPAKAFGCGLMLVRRVH
jgi:CRISPR system Cascade subunit CasE